MIFELHFQKVEEANYYIDYEDIHCIKNIYKKRKAQKRDIFVTFIVKELKC